MQEKSLKRKTNMATSSTDADDELRAILSEQRRELMSTQTLDSDLDVAFHLQMQEAITASLALHPSSSSSSASPSSSSSAAALQPPLLIQDDDALYFAALMDEEFEKLEQICRDREMSSAEMRAMRDDLNRRIHDQKVASEILRIPEDEWKNSGNNFERPYGEGSSGTVMADESFRVYFKGLVSEERIRDSRVTVAAIGVAICDVTDHPIFELQKPLTGGEDSVVSREAVEIEALVEGLNAAIALDLKRVTCYCDELHDPSICYRQTATNTMQDCDISQSGGSASEKIYILQHASCGTKQY
ncbi:hypothetical protein L1049_013938 [Liquidambar formosana]|uniref:RNase H type-1 domain-containing protein n=1 Tax=Liquidambar formosana TaxID=63359 RepID=A0AAP0RQ46_LIQFO